VPSIKKFLSFFVLFFVVFALPVEVFSSVTINSGTISGSRPQVNPSALSSKSGFSRPRALKAYPSFSKMALSGNSLGAGENALFRFKVSAWNGPVGITQFTAKIIPKNAAIRNINIYGFKDVQYLVPIEGVSAGGKLRSSNVASLDSENKAEINVTSASGGVNAVQIPKGEERFFELRAQVSNIMGPASLQAVILGDAELPITGEIDTAAGIRSSGHDNLIWSPNTNGESTTRTKDWTNGFDVPGLNTLQMEEINLIVPFRNMNTRSKQKMRAVF